MVTIEKTELGEFKGRNAIYLDYEIYSHVDSSLSFLGEVNGTLCSEVQSDDFIPYNIKFKDVRNHKKITIDEWYSLDEPIHERASSFYSINNGDDRKFFFKTYDWVFEVWAKDYEISFDQDT